MLLLSVLFTLAAVCLARCRAEDPFWSPGDDKDENVDISALCAANIIVAGGTLGGLAAYVVTPAALCTAGFCPAGVTAGSFASWWQSTIPVVAKGSLFSQLTSLAMGGAGSTNFVLASSALGGATGALYAQSFCAFVDDTDPASYMGKLFGGNLALVQASIQAKEAAQKQCASSETCTAVMDTAMEAGQAAKDGVSSMWNWGKSYASKSLKFIVLKSDIYEFENQKMQRIHTFGEETFDYWRASEKAMEGLGYADCLENVIALENELREEQRKENSKAYKIKRIREDISEKKGEFGERIFQYTNSQKELAELSWSEPDCMAPLSQSQPNLFTVMFWKARCDVGKIEKLILEKTDEIAALS